VYVLLIDTLLAFVAFDFFDDIAMHHGYYLIGNIFFYLWIYCSQNFCWLSNLLTLRVPDECYSNLLILRVPDECYSNLLTLRVPDECYSNLLTLRVPDECYSNLLILRVPNECYSNLLTEST
jgi:hypothetical protein